MDFRMISGAHREFSIHSPKVRNMLTAISPSYFRLGGASSGLCKFVPSGYKAEDFYEHPNITQWRTSSKWKSKFCEYDEEDVSSMLTFLNETNHEPMLDLNLFMLTNDGTGWNSTNAKLLLNFLSEKGFRVPRFQLGNEPTANVNNFDMHVANAKFLADSMSNFSRLLRTYPMFENSGIIGPENTLAMRGQPGKKKFFRDFVEAGGDHHLSAYGHHFYYNLYSKAPESAFTDLTVMDKLKNEIEEALIVTKLCNATDLDTYLTETAPAGGGGAKSCSGRYCGGFLYTDQISVAAQYGIKYLHRMSFRNGLYGLTQKSGDTIDFWIHLGLKKLALGPVLNVTMDDKDKKLRAYANCANPAMKEYLGDSVDKKPKAGGIVVTFVNLHNERKKLRLKPFSYSQRRHIIYQFWSPSMTSKDLYIYNGTDYQLLSLGENDEVPRLPHHVLKKEGGVYIDKMSFGFIYYPDYEFSLCKKFFRK